MKDFDSIYREFQPKIYRYLSNLINEAEALDLTQAVFLKVSKSLEGFRGEASPATWIYRIATNTAHDHACSALAQQKRSELQLDEDASLDDFPDHGTPGTDSEYIRREMNACIRGVVDQLPEGYRTVLLLSDFEELTNPEIAEILNISIDTVKIRLHRGRTELRKAMESQCSLYHDERNELMCDRKPK
ncbi:RNA polymerase sigma-H factor [Geobacter sp. OR-1]|uniref:sigma-70 family RNA polymerase sigma factor n=1 Tax=Geobacter sp. OR-1 TaxID=1266765 RepID=UPI0005423CD8|nr:sigma-70 family RNA polymerase sigma factor [Geobacter sp. OR-1]GAM09897.1 RNA polymerase sigma-H factor [Geobacter sp. OR-1]